MNLLDLNYLAVVVSAVAAFVASASGAWYAGFGDQLDVLSSADQSRPMAQVVPVELVRNMIVALVVAGLVAFAGVTGLAGGVTLGLALWVGFPVVLLWGSVFHENVPWRLAALHAGDWLIKLLVISGIVAIWR